MSELTIILGLLQTVIVLGVGHIIFVVIMKQKNNQLYRLMLMISICALIQNAAYILELYSTNVAEALVSIRMYYLGGAFVATLFLFLTRMYCGYTTSKKIFTILVLFNVLVIFSVWTCEFNPLYYTSVDFVTDAPLPHVVLGKGILYLCYAAVNLTLIIVCVVTAGISVKRATDIKQKKTLLLLMCSSIIPFLSYIIGATGIWGGYDPVPCATGIGVILFSFIAFYQHSFDLVEIAHENIVQTMDEAIIIVDDQYGFTEANEKAILIFPELKFYERERT